MKKTIPLPVRLSVALSAIVRLRKMAGETAISGIIVSPVSGHLFVKEVGLPWLFFPTSTVWLPVELTAKR